MDGYGELLDGLRQAAYIVNSWRTKLPPWVEMADLAEEAVVAVLAALGRYDSSRGEARFKDYVQPCIRGALIDYLRKVSPLALKNKWLDIEALEICAVRAIADNETAKHIIASTELNSLSRKMLTREELMLLELHYIRGVSQGAISRKLGMAHSAVTMALQRAIGKVREENLIYVGRNGNGRRKCHITL